MIKSKKVKSEVKRAKRADVMEVNLSVGTTIGVRDELSKQSEELSITKSRAANILIDHCLSNGTFEKLIKDITK